MLTTQEFDPKPAAETRQLEFDFELASGELVSSGSVTAAVWSGTDSTPAALLGAVTTGSSSVRVIATGGVAGVIYLLTASAVTSLGRTLVKQGYLAVQGAL